MDGIDGVLVDIADAMAPPASTPSGDAALRVLAEAHTPMPAALGAEFLALNTAGPDELQRGALAANALARLLLSAGVDHGAVRAVGSHGQTVRHRPGEFDGTGFTIQLNNGALLAEACGIDVVCDFRSRDIAAGGQGAPLVPAFHAAVFGGVTNRAVLNVGGIANLTLLAPRAETGAGAASKSSPARGFDCGPGNALMDHWCRTHTGAPYDDRGHWAAGGRVDPALLATLMAEPYFLKAPPKSTGRDLFNVAWLDRALAKQSHDPSSIDVQATLLELTARSASDALLDQAPQTEELLVCGGGSLNDTLMARLATLLPGLAVSSTESAGLPPMQVEAAAFAWLAQRFCARLPGSHPAVTGTAGPRVLGALYPA